MKRLFFFRNLFPQNLVKACVAQQSTVYGTKLVKVDFNPNGTAIPDVAINATEAAYALATTTTRKIVRAFDRKFQNTRHSAFIIKHIDLTLQRTILDERQHE